MDDKKNMALAYRMKKKMAMGGSASSEEMPCGECMGAGCPSCDDSDMVARIRKKMTSDDVMKNSDEAAQNSPMMKPIKDKKFSEDYGESTLIDRIMKKRMSKGGMVANSDHGEDDEDLAGFSPNEFDDLSLRDDLEEHYTGKNSGDEIGDEQEDEDREDIISRIMRSRRKKDKMPIAGYGRGYGEDK